jgi:hypothetical protein
MVKRFGSRSTNTKKKSAYFTSLDVALQWKILVIPLWMSSDFPSISKTDERIVLKSLRAKAAQNTSPPSCRLLIECRDPIDSEISDTASWRAQIRCRSHKGCVNCMNITRSKNYRRAVDIMKDFRVVKLYKCSAIYLVSVEWYIMQAFI